MRLIHTVSQALRKVCKFFASILRFVGLVRDGCNKVADTLEESERKEFSDANSQTARRCGGTSIKIHKSDRVSRSVHVSVQTSGYTTSEHCQGHSSCRTGVEMDGLNHPSVHLEDQNSSEVEDKSLERAERRHRE